MLSAAKTRARRRLDERLAQFTAVAERRPPPKGWVRAIRESLGMTGIQFARRLGVASQSMADLERSEAKGTIQLATLRRAAAALDCELVYALVPATSLEHTVKHRAHKVARDTLARVDQTMTLEDQRVPFEDAQLDDYVQAYVRERDLWNE